MMYSSRSSGPSKHFQFDFIFFLYNTVHPFLFSLDQRGTFATKTFRDKLFAGDCIPFREPAQACSGTARESPYPSPGVRK
jgi:hypothetical protein